MTESDCVVGVTWAPLDISDLGEGGEVLLAIGQPTPRNELAVAREDVAVLVEHGRRQKLGDATWLGDRGRDLSERLEVVAADERIAVRTAP